MHFALTAIENVTPGMVLSDDLLDHQGHVLLAQGVVLSDNTIAALHRHQVDMVPIVTGDSSTEENVVEQNHYAERLIVLYRKLDEDADNAASTLRQHIRDFRLGVTA